MLVTVNFFSFFRYLTGRDQLSVDLAESATLVELMNSLNRRFDSPAFSEQWTIMVVNHKDVPPETILREGDDVLLFPMLEGG